MQSSGAKSKRDSCGYQEARFLCRTIFLAFLSLAGAVTCLGQTNVLTYHNDNGRTGQNLNEVVLTPANVNYTNFGNVGFMAVDGLVDGQPLYVANLIIGGSAHNVIFIVTENDSVYAFDADSFTQLWHTSVLGLNETASDNRGCSQVTPEIGITSTPVIDPSAGAHGTIFVVAMSKDSNGNYYQRLHALDITTGIEQSGGPTLIAATFPGTGENSSNGQVVFNPAQYKERAALLLQGGVIYTTWASHCDDAPYTGWIIAFSESTFQQVAVLNVTPNGSDGAIWMSGAGPAADASGNIYFLDGNGTFDTTLTTSGFPNEGDYGNAFIKLGLSGGTISVLDYFTMSNTVAESGVDEDLGSGGELVLPNLTDASGNIHQLAVGAGKGGVIYVVNRNSMGKFDASGDQIYQEISSALSGGAFSTPAYFNGTLYYGAVGDSLKALPITNALVATAASSQSSETFAYPGTTPSISANGSSNGIVWAVQNLSPAVLHAYNASNLATELYNSNQAGTRDQFADNKYITPLIDNGKVYVGTPTGVAVFGLLSTVATPVFNPTGGILTSSQTISITDSTSGTTIYYTTDGSTPSPGVGTTQLYTAPFTLSSSATVEAVAVVTASSNKSALASASFTVSNGSSSAANAISIDFVGLGTAMGSTEQAGVVPESNWNDATGAVSNSTLA
ncbi:MAG: chitobiase/beta-hexosaminidase C-terminal domain-containing protein, partial [Candidatus Acidiferrum sp.]